MQLNMNHPQQKILLIQWLVFVFVCLGVIAGGYGIAAKLRSQQRTQVTNDLQAIGLLKAEAVAEWLDELRSASALLAADEFLARALYAFTEKGPDSIEGGLVKKRLLQIRNNHAYNSVQYIDRAGTVVLSTQEDFKLDAEEKASLAETLAHHSVNFTGMHHREIHAEEGIGWDIFVPITYPGGEQGRVLGVILIRADARQLILPLIQSWPYQTKSAESLLVRREGDHVLYLNDLRFPDGAGRERGFPVEEKDLTAAMALRGAAGNLTGVDYRGVEVLAFAHKVRGTDWVLITKVDAAEVYAPLRRIAWGATGIILFLLLLIFGVFLYRTKSCNAQLLSSQYRSQLDQQALAQHFDYLSKYANDIILLTNDDWDILEVNDKAPASYRYARSEMIGMPVSRLIAPDGNNRADLFDASYNDGFIFESVHKRQDNTIFPVEVSLRKIDVEGKKYRQLIVRDITERKQLDEKLRESQEKLSVIANNARDAIIMVAADGSILFWNATAERFFGYRAEEVNGKALSEFIVPQRYIAAHKSGLQQFKSTGEGSIIGKTSEVTARRKDGTELNIELSVSKVLFRGTLCAIGILHDITQRIVIRSELSRYERALKILSSCNRALVGAVTEQGLLDDICRIITASGNYKLAWVGYVEKDAKRTVRPVASSGFDTGYLQNMDSRWDDSAHGRGPVGLAIKSGSYFVCNDVHTDPAMAPWWDAAESYGYRSLITLPLKQGDEVFGVLGIYADKTSAFEGDEIALLLELADDMSFGISALRTACEKAEKSQQLSASLVQTINAIATMVEKRDPYTAGHMRHVSQLAVAIARELDLPVEQIEGIKLGADIHDIGKIYVPAEILNRPGELTRAEFEIIKSHCQVGYDIIKDIDFPWPVAKMILEHHERLNGSGYPHGLQGSEIILEAQILAVADVLEAISAHRPYRPALGIDAGLAEIKKYKTEYFNPEAVDACVQLIEKEGFEFAE